MPESQELMSLRRCSCHYDKTLSSLKIKIKFLVKKKLCKGSQSSTLLQQSINVELILNNLSQPCSPLRCNCLINNVKVVFDARLNLKLISD